MIDLELRIVVGNMAIILLIVLIICILVWRLFCVYGTQADDAKPDTTAPSAGVLQVSAAPSNDVRGPRDARENRNTHIDINSRAQSTHSNTGGGRITNVNNGEVTHGGYAPFTHTNTGGVIVVNGEVINGGWSSGGVIVQSQTYAENWSSDEEYQYRSRHAIIRRNRRRGVRVTQSVRFH